MNKYHIAWWNVENLFAPEDDPTRHERLAKALRAELTGWTQQVLDLKIAQLASVIRQMNDGRGPFSST